MGFSLNTHTLVHHKGKFKRYYDHSKAIFREGHRLVVDQPFLNRDGTLFSTEKVYVVDTVHDCSVELMEESSSEEYYIVVSEFDYHRFRLQKSHHSLAPEYTPGTKIRYWRNKQWRTGYIKEVHESFAVIKPARSRKARFVQTINVGYQHIEEFESIKENSVSRKINKRRRKRINTKTEVGRMKKTEVNRMNAEIETVVVYVLDDCGCCFVQENISEDPEDEIFYRRSKAEQMFHKHLPKRNFQSDIRFENGEYIWYKGNENDNEWALGKVVLSPEIEWVTPKIEFTTFPVTDAYSTRFQVANMTTNQLSPFVRNTVKKYCEILPMLMMNEKIRFFPGGRWLTGNIVGFHPLVIESECSNKYEIEDITQTKQLENGGLEIGQPVYMRDSTHTTWSIGYVTGLEDDLFPYITEIDKTPSHGHCSVWNQVKPRAMFSVGEMVQYQQGGNTEWCLGTVASVSPLKIQPYDSSAVLGSYDHSSAISISCRAVEKLTERFSEGDIIRVKEEFYDLVYDQYYPSTKTFSYRVTARKVAPYLAEDHPWISVLNLTTLQISKISAFNACYLTKYADTDTEITLGDYAVGDVLKILNPIVSDELLKCRNYRKPLRPWSSIKFGIFSIPRQFYKRETGHCRQIQLDRNIHVIVVRASSSQLWVKWQNDHRALSTKYFACIGLQNINDICKAETSHFYQPGDTARVTAKCNGFQPGDIVQIQGREGYSAALTVNNRQSIFISQVICFKETSHFYEPGDTVRVTAKCDGLQPGDIVQIRGCQRYWEYPAALTVDTIQRTRYIPRYFDYIEPWKVSENYRPGDILQIGCIPKYGCEFYYVQTLRRFFIEEGSIVQIHEIIHTKEGYKLVVKNVLCNLMVNTESIEIDMWQPTSKSNRYVSPNNVDDFLESISDWAEAIELCEWNEAHNIFSVVFSFLTIFRTTVSSKSCENEFTIGQTVNCRNNGKWQDWWRPGTVMNLHPLQVEAEVVISHVDVLQTREWGEVRGNSKLLNVKTVNLKLCMGDKVQLHTQYKTYGGKTAYNGTVVNLRPFRIMDEQGRHHNPTSQTLCILIQGNHEFCINDKIQYTRKITGEMWYNGTILNLDPLIIKSEDGHTFTHDKRKFLARISLKDER